MAVGGSGRFALKRAAACSMTASMRSHSKKAKNGQMTVKHRDRERDRKNRAEKEIQAGPRQGGRRRCGRSGLHRKKIPRGTIHLQLRRYMRRRLITGKGSGKSWRFPRIFSARRYLR